MPNKLNEDIKANNTIFLGKILNSHSAFLYPGVEMGIEELSGNPGKILGGNLAME